MASGNARGAVTGALSGMLFYGIGSYYQSEYGAWAHIGGNTGAPLTTAGWASKSVAHGFAGGIMSELEGDTFGHGFVAAGFTESLSGYVNGRQYMATRVLAATVVGGTASRLSGGKFANGALTAAFSRALNEESHNWSVANAQERRNAAAAELKSRRSVVLFGQFGSPDSAALWFADTTQDIVTRYGFEIGANINRSLRGGYYLSNLTLSYHRDSQGVGFMVAIPLSDQASYVAYVHDHQNNGGFSEQDLFVAIGRYGSAYVSTPDNSLYRFNYQAYMENRPNLSWKEMLGNPNYVEKLRGP